MLTQNFKCYRRLDKKSLYAASKVWTNIIQADPLLRTSLRRGRKRKRHTMAKRGRKRTKMSSSLKNTQTNGIRFQSASV